MISGERVGIALLAGVTLQFQPSTRRDLGYTRAYTLINPEFRKTGTAYVMQAQNLSVHETAFLSVARVQGYLFGTFRPIRSADRAMVELAVELVTGLV